MTNIFLMLTAGFLLAGCFSPALESKNWAVADGQSQIVIYRNDSSKDLRDFQPLVLVNDVSTDRCIQGNAFIIDVPPGTHNLIFEVFADFGETVKFGLGLLKKGKTGEKFSDKVKKTRGKPYQVTTKPNERIFVKCRILIGNLAAPKPELRTINSATGTSQAKWLQFTGRY